MLPSIITAQTGLSDKNIIFSSIEYIVGGLMVE
jgi:hypothetical protein